MAIAFFLEYKTLIIVLLIAIVIVIGVFFMKNDADLGNGYEYQANRGDNLHIRKGGKVVVDSTIVDLAVAQGYIVGLRLTAQHLQCNGGYKIRLKNTKRYFIVNTATDDIQHYHRVGPFQAKLRVLDLLNKVTLDYSLLDFTWATYSQYYKNIDFSQCQVIAHQ